MHDLNPRTFIFYFWIVFWTALPGLMSLHHRQMQSLISVWNFRSTWLLLLQVHLLSEIKGGFISVMHGIFFITCCFTNTFIFLKGKVIYIFGHRHCNSIVGFNNHVTNSSIFFPSQTHLFTILIYFCSTAAITKWFLFSLHIFPPLLIADSN